MDHLLGQRVSFFYNTTWETGHVVGVNNSRKTAIIASTFDPFTQRIEIKQSRICTQTNFCKKVQNQQQLEAFGAVVSGNDDDDNAAKSGTNLPFYGVPRIGLRQSL